jgi:Outer membrane protein beta-barrel domain
MKKFFITALVFLATTTAFAQKKHKNTQNPPPATDSTKTATKTPAASTTPVVGPAKPKKDWSKVDLTKRAADHFMIQFGYDNWLGVPDSINIKGFNHSEGFYFMYDFPFKTDPRFSVGAGIGISSSNIFFDQTYPQVAAYGNQTLAFTNVAGSTGTFKKFKLVTTFIEIPVELRFALDPEHMDKSWKFAVGTKLGLLLSAYTKGTDPTNNGIVVSHSSEKESSKQFFSSPRFAPMIRVSKGVFGVYAQLQANSLIKTNAGPSVFPVSFGFVLSGL